MSLKQPLKHLCNQIYKLLYCHCHNAQGISQWLLLIKIVISQIPGPVPSNTKKGGSPRWQRNSLWRKWVQEKMF